MFCPQEVGWLNEWGGVRGAAGQLGLGCGDPSCPGRGGDGVATAGGPLRTGV